MTKHAPDSSRSRSRPVSLPGLLALFYLSGAAALIYQVLWLKQLGRLFGVSAYATSTTLAVFFLGLAAGGWAWGRRSASIRRPLRTYAVLEVAIAASALLYFALFAVYAWIQEPLFGALGYRPGLVLAVKFLLAVGILFLPAFFMGGTLPVMAQYLVRRRTELGAKATLLYAVNTVGAATGALAAGFFLPRWLGFQGAYFVAIGLNLGVAAITAWWDLRREAPGTAQEREAGPAGQGATTEADDFAEGRKAPGPADSLGAALDPAPAAPVATPLGVGSIRLLAAFSGFVTLGLEVLWTRMYQQVLQNSVYTFSIILTVFLLCLAGGAVLAHWLCRRARSHTTALANLLLLSGLLVAITPGLFLVDSGGLEFWHSGLGFRAYVLAVFAGTLVTLGPAVVAMGAVFPYLMKVSEDTMVSAGRTVGELASINTLLAILGSLAAGFVLLEWLGLWTSIWAFAATYFLAALVVAGPGRRSRRGGRGWLQRGLAGAGAAGCLVLAFAHDLPMVRLERVAETEVEEVVEAWEGPDGTVAVVRHGAGNLRLRVNSSYNLGSSASAVNERLQGQIPFLLHPEPRKIFFLGLGTGISASGAMAFPFESLTVCEVNPDVVRAARRHFQPWLEGLFEDPRVQVVPEDGRTWLAIHDERYDLVVGDIFLSYKAGVASLYTLEHFREVRDSLEPGGVFVQWIPAFDTSPEEFAILARTLLEVFPQVTLWRRSLSPVFPVYALVGSMEERPLDMAHLQEGLVRLEREGGLDPRTWLLNIPLAAYVANLSRVEDTFASAPLNTDDRTVLEYMAPVTERESKGARTRPVLAWHTLLQFDQELHAAAPPRTDPYLARATPAQRLQPLAGTAFYGYEVMRRTGDEAAARTWLERYQELVQAPGAAADP